MASSESHRTSLPSRTAATTSPSRVLVGPSNGRLSSGGHGNGDALANVVHNGTNGSPRVYVAAPRASFAEYRPNFGRNGEASLGSGHNNLLQCWLILRCASFDIGPIKTWQALPLKTPRSRWHLRDNHGSKLGGRQQNLPQQHTSEIVSLLGKNTTRIYLTRAAGAALTASWLKMDTADPSAYLHHIQLRCGFPKFHATIRCERDAQRERSKRSRNSNNWHRRQRHRRKRNRNVILLEFYCPSSQQNICFCRCDQ